MNHIVKPNNDDIARFSKHEGVIKPDERELEKFGKLQEVEVPVNVGSIGQRQELTVLPADDAKKTIGWTVLENDEDNDNDTHSILMQDMPEKIPTDKIDQYRSTWGKEYQKPESYAWTSVEVLPFLKGRQCDDFVLSYIHTLRPSCIRVTEGMCTLDCRAWRVTVFVDANNKVKKIEQEVDIAACGLLKNGYQLEVYLKTGKYAKMPKGSVCVINSKALAKINAKIKKEKNKKKK